MPWEDGDRLRITDALLLDSTADHPTSILETLMNQLQSRHPERVEQVQDLLEKIEALKEIEDDISAKALDFGTVKSVSSYLEGSKTYQDNLKGVSDSTRRDKLRSFRQRIRRYLDQHGYLARYNGVGRAIDAV